VGLSIDDFGTGYSSLSQLHNLPFTTLKIDRSFVSNMVADSEAFVIIQALVNLSDALHLSLVAEGAETTSDIELLRDMGCELCQGYYFSRPLLARDMEDFLRTYREEEERSKLHEVVPVGVSSAKRLG